MSVKSHLKIVMGAMTFGAAGKGVTRIHDLDDCAAVLDVFQAHGHTEVDTSRIYGLGTTEEYLASLEWQKRGLNVATKVVPFGDTMHTPEGIRTSLERSLTALKADKLELFYLHSPDRSVSWEVTFKAIDDLHKEGKFDKLGISNYAAWEVAEIVTLCRANGWIQPTVYQGLYNVIHRGVEPELFPCLGKFSISFYAYNPLGGGFFTGRYKSIDVDAESGSRFDKSKPGIQTTLYQDRYWKAEYFKALEIVKAAVEKQGLTLPETALRWLSHHSQLKSESGDAVIIGASSIAHITQNLLDLEKGPLPESVVQACEEAWMLVKPTAQQYWHQLE